MARVTTFLTVRTDRVDVGLEAARVTRVELGVDWTGPPPLDVEVLLEPGRPRLQPSRVLVVRTGDGEVVLGTRCEIVLRRVSAEDICELPAILWSSSSIPAVSSIAQEANEPPLLLLETSTLASRVADLARNEE